MNYLKLLGCVLILYVFFAHFTPFIVRFFPNWQAYVDAADEYGIDPGALYYTDVPIAVESGLASQEAVIKAYGSTLGYKPVEKEHKKSEIKKETPKQNPCTQVPNEQ